MEKKDSKRGEYVFVAHVDSTTMQLKVTRLFEGVDYMFRVFAENPAGLSLPGETDKPIRAKIPFGEFFDARTVPISPVGSHFMLTIYSQSVRLFILKKVDRCFVLFIAGELRL